MVTGSTGFKGAWLANWLIMLGAKVVGVGLRPERDSIIFNSLNLNKKINQYFIDIKNFNKINSVIKKEKPTGIKGNFIISTFLTSTMGISYKLKTNI